MAETSSDTPVLDLLGVMTAASMESSTLSPEQLMIARIAALIAVDAPPVSYLVNIGALEETDVDVETLQGIFLAIAPIVGTARVASAASKIVRALGLAIAVAEEDMSEE
jgi:4-carboxymuconolactone decarboxylase